MHGHYTQPYYIGKFKKNQNRMRRKKPTIICICMKSANSWFSSDQPPSLKSSSTSSWNARLHFFFSLLLWNIMIFPFVKNPKSYGWNLWNFIFDRSNLNIKHLFFKQWLFLVIAFSPYKIYKLFYMYMLIKQIENRTPVFKWLNLLIGD